MRYAIGDIQGCYAEFQNLLELIEFNEHSDTLWLAGDLINRGPDSKAVLDFLMQLKPSPIITLGNHDLHCLAVAYGARDYHPRKDTFETILQSSKRDDYIEFLRKQSLLYVSEDYVLSHAGIPPMWDIAKAQALANEVETVLRGDDIQACLMAMYGDTPDCWSDALQAYERIRVIINYFTRMRFIDRSGRLFFKCKTVPGSQPEGFYPWFELTEAGSRQQTLLFGHWAALEGATQRDDIIALDNGCVWGGALTALRLEDGKRFQVPSLQEKRV